MVYTWSGRNAAELLKDYVKDGKIEVESLKESADKGVVASRIALEMLANEGFKI